MKVTFVFLFCIQSIYIAIVGGGSTCPRECPATYDPVCGTDGNTYGNECFLLDAMCHNNRLSRANLGACPGTASLMPVCNHHLVVCYAIWDPICALDGHTYSSPCRLNAKNCGTNHIRMNHTGACDGDLLGS